MDILQGTSGNVTVPEGVIIFCKKENVRIRKDIHGQNFGVM